VISFLRKAWWTVRRSRKDAELQEEIRFHLEESTELRQEEGQRSEDARLAAIREFGNSTLIAERTRDTWSWSWIDQLRQDLGYGARTLWRSPWFTLTAIAVLTVGIGANLALLQVLNAALFHRLSVRDADSIVGLAPATADPAVQFYADHNDTFEYIVAEKTDGVFVEDQLEAETSTFVSPAYFSHLGVIPAEGRLLDADDGEAGAPPVAVLGFRFWQHHYGGDREIVGRIVHLNESPVQIIGVAPATFNGLSDVRPSLFIPVSNHPYLFHGSRLLVDFSDRTMLMYAKPRPTVSVRAAVQELSSLAAELQRQHPDQIKSAEPPVVRRALPVEAASGLVFATLLVSLVLIAACANLGNLLLARGQYREREIAIRVSLGATPGRIVRQLMVENSMLAALGAATGLGLAYITAKIVLAVSDAPPEMHVVTDWWIVGAGAALALFATLLFGLAPALQTVRKSKPTRTRRLLIGVQVAASCFLLIMTSLLVRSARQSIAVNVRFDYRHMLVVAPRLYNHNISGAAARQTLEDMARRLQQHSAVAGVTLSASPTLGRKQVQSGGPSLPQMSYFQVAPSYLALMNLPLVRGRLFLDNERNVVVLSESAARAIWPNDDPLGKTITTTRFSALRGDSRKKTAMSLIDKSAEQRTVIGVVKDSFVSPHSGGEAYLAMSDDDLSGATIIVRTKADPSDLIRALRSLGSLPGLVPAAWLMRSDVEQEAGPPPGVVTSLAALGVSATLLSGFGIFGLIAFAVAQRTREIGVRIALGATPAKIVRTLSAQYAGAIAGGMAAGLVFAVTVSLLIRNQFVGVGPNLRDPLSYLAALAVLVTVAAIAILIPAYRGTTVDPASALRWD
jgi:predicted permease